MSAFDPNNTDHVSLLLYLETRAVDHGGIFRGMQMNDVDNAILDSWSRQGYIVKRRVCAEDLHKVPGGVFVDLSEDAYQDAATHRRAKAERLKQVRNYRSTEEFRNQPILKEEDGE